MTGQIVLEPFGGLGNRMRSLVSAVKLSNHLGKQLSIEWPTGLDFNCSFEKLFRPIPDFSIRPLHKGTYYSSYNASPIKRKIIDISNRLRGFDLVIWEQDLAKTFYRPGFAVDELQKYTNIYIRSCEHFFGGDKWNMFEPIAELNQIIHTVSARFSASTIGVHIRRKDNPASIRVSGTDAFLDAMRNELIRDPGTTFFVATDEPAVVHEIKDHFDDRILFLYEKEFSRSVEKGIQDGLIDLYCLSKCSKILGSYWSSFSEVASYIGKSELVIAANSPSA